MASFSEADSERLDWRIMQYSSVALYWRRELFEQAVSWLQDHNYAIHRISCDTTLKDFRLQLSRALRFNELFGYEPWNGGVASLDDAFWHLDFSGREGIAFAFSRIDRRMKSKYNRSLMHEVLDVIEGNSRNYMLLGKRLLCVAQSDNWALQFAPIGAREPTWMNTR
jgi:hypothetical protein